MVQKLFLKNGERRQRALREQSPPTGERLGASDDISPKHAGVVSFVSGPNRQRPFEVLVPKSVKSPLIFASPHSGRIYPDELLASTRLSRSALRQSEDCYVDLLFASAPKLGAPLVKALFPRAYIDVNRRDDELDPRMFSGALTRRADSKSSRVLAGLGAVPRIVADGKNIYARKLKPEEAEVRLSACYYPYHKALKALIRQTREQFGVAIVIDCHSMPAIGGAPMRPGEPSVDFVIGDRFGTSAAPGLTGLIETFLSQRNYVVTRNTPYAGGHVANSYGRPSNGVHVVQIEINRSLYLNEEKFTRTDGFAEIKLTLEDMILDLMAIEPNALSKTLAPAWAAE